MKKLNINVIFLLTIICLLASGCSNKGTLLKPDVSAGTVATSTVVYNTQESISKNSGQPDKNEFSLIFDSGFLSLKDIDRNVNLNNILGEPIEENLEKLGSNADTHAGSSIKTLNYDGITLKLFSPPNNGGFFWVMDMKVYGHNFRTFRGISVGDTSSDLKQAYSDISQVLDGRTDQNNCAYSFNENELFIKFEIKDGVIKEIYYYVEIP